MTSQTSIITIIGAGLAGCEAAWQAAGCGMQVRLVEMKPLVYSPAHQSPNLAELVCSNSLRGSAIENAAGLLKEELRRLGSLLMEGAQATRVPAGGALAVDREAFSQWVTRAIESAPGITIEHREARDLPQDRPLILASGPLTSSPLAGAISQWTGEDSLFFYDAVAPIVDGETIDRDVAFEASRYGKGGADYLNLPLDRPSYEAFVEALLTAETFPFRPYEEGTLFEGCLPVDEMAARGRDVLAYGPMKPVGLVDPRTDKRPHAVVQLRRDNAAGTLFHLVGFQTKLTRPEQRRVFRMIPGLEKAEFVRYGSLHRNIFLKAPEVLHCTLQFKRDPAVLAAGQISGVEGYIESTAMGWLAGRNAARLAAGRPLLTPPPTTAIGALARYIAEADPEGFQPMNINFGLLPGMEKRMRRRERRAALAARALADLETWRAQVND